MPSSIIPVLDCKTETERLNGEQRRAPYAQGVEDLKGNVSQKFLFSPMKMYHATSGTALLSAKPGVRYFIHSVYLSWNNTAATDGSQLGIAFTVDGVERKIGLYPVPSVAGSGAVSHIVDALCDANTVVELDITGTFSTRLATISFMEMRG